MSDISSRFGMFDLNINKFLQTQKQMVVLATRIDTLIEVEGLEDTINAETREMLGADFTEMAAACSVVDSKLAELAASRMGAKLFDAKDEVTVRDVRTAIKDVESRMTDECELITVLVLNREQKKMFHSAADEVSGWPISIAFPEAARELDEASRCYALERSTAAVYHGMRMLEIGLLKFSSHLGIEDPAKPTERNWGNMLNNIKEQIDVNYPKKERMPKSLGAAYEDIYSSLDAVKNPWRNATMHADAFYQDGEARYILNNVIMFLKKVYEVCKEPELPLSDEEN